MQHITNVNRRRRLGVRHHLTERADSVEAVAADLVGIHSSDPGTVFLAARARVNDLTVPSLESRLYDDRPLLRMHGMRRTLFVVPRELAGIMDASCTQAYLPAQVTRIARMVESNQLAEDGEAWVRGLMDKTETALEELGPSSASELTRAIPLLATKLRFGTASAGMSTRILFLLSATGRVLRGRSRGSWLSSQYVWALTSDWIPSSLSTWEPFEARAELTTRWLRTCGPGSLTDIQWWSGWSKTLTKAALTDVGAVEIRLDDGTGFVLPGDDTESSDSDSWAALLPALDPTPMGWKERSWFGGCFPGPHYDRNGNIGPTVWPGGGGVGEPSRWHHSSDHDRNRHQEPDRHDRGGPNRASALVGEDGRHPPLSDTAGKGTGCRQLGATPHKYPPRLSGPSIR